MSEIPFWFHDKPKWVSGITRHTTCQDIIHSLVKAHMTKGGKELSTSKLQDIKATCQQLVLVEQWRGVERPLSNSSKILKLWQAWGEERCQVRFIVKRIVQHSSKDLDGHSIASSRMSAHRKGRRGGTKLASSNRSSLADTVHPSALAKHPDSASSIERLMRIILTQGETIHSQLKSLQEREGQIATIEEEVHAERTKTAGKDYLLKAYLENNVSDGDDRSSGGVKRKSNKSDKENCGDPHPVPECLHDMLEALSRVQALNDKLENTEEALYDLQCKFDARKGRSKSVEHTKSGDMQDLEFARSEVSKLKTLNDKTDREIDINRQLINSMRLAFDERKALVYKLEKDVQHSENTGQQLEKELKSVTSTLFADPINDLYVNEDVEDEDLMKDIVLNEQYQLSNSQLYEDMPIEPKATLNQIPGLQVKTSLDLLSTHRSSSCTDSARINATGSPGSSTSGNSSSGCGTGSDSNSVPSSGREGILSTPDLPPLPPGEYPPFSSKTKSLTSQYTKSILKSVDPSGDLDSNSDTGLSSLHSSSDEGTYVLDTLV